MQDFKKRHHTPRALRLGARALGLALLATVAFFTIRAAGGMYGKLSEASEGELAAQAQLTSLSQQEGQIGAHVEAMQGGRGLEEVVRDRFGLVKPGEGEIQIVRQDSDVETASSTPGSFWQKLLHALWVW